jgi:tetratricopeptide (TPR) repeat protein
MLWSGPALASGGRLAAHGAASTTEGELHCPAGALFVISTSPPTPVKPPPEIRPISPQEQGLVLDDLGQHERAVTALEESLRILAAAQGADHIDNAEVLTALGRALNASGKSDSARVVLVRVLAIHSDRMENGHPGYAAALTALAETELSLGNASAAERLLRAADAILRRALGDDHPQLALTLDALGWALAERAPVSAVQVLEEALVIRTKRLGEVHPLTQRTRSALEQLRARQVSPG